jgi:phosphohistidine phosphatase
MLTLHLLRHAKTNQISKSGKDFDRELLSKGEKQCVELKKYFEENKLVFNEVFCSTAKRTLQTHGLVGLDDSSTVFLKGLYLASSAELLYNIQSNANSNEILLVGHNEGISELASYLCDDWIQLKTGGYVCIEIVLDNWSELSVGVGSLKCEFRPEILE